MARPVGIVVPAYRPDTDQLASYLHTLDERLDPAALRVELDAPRSTAVVDRLRETPATVSLSPERRGKGAALTHGFEALDTPVRAFTDADGSTPAGSVRAVLDRVHGGADLAVGSRRHPEANVQGHQTVLRRYLGDGFAWLARRTVPTTLYDYQCGAKAMTADTWRAVRPHLYEHGFWDIELDAIAGALEYHIEEVPVTWADRPGSTVDPVAAGAEFLRALVFARHRALSLAGHPVHGVVPNRDDSPLVETVGHE